MTTVTKLPTPTNPQTPDIIESVLIKGDLSKLTPQERNTYYLRVCQSIGLNPLTMPFEYIVLNSKMRLYALRNCTDQLRTIHKVSVEELVQSERDGVFIVTSKVKNAEGRTDAAIGAVPIAGLKGEALANAMMKAETKSKRRATLSLCGLGFLDETEAESIPAAAKEIVDGETGTIDNEEIALLKDKFAAIPGADAKLQTAFLKRRGVTDWGQIKKGKDFDDSVIMLEAKAASMVKAAQS